jgi:HEAT repeat protein
LKKQKTAGLVLLCLFLVLALFWKWNESRLPLHSRLTAVQDETRNLALVQWLKLSPSKKEAVVSDLLKDVKSPAWQTRRYALYALRKSGLHNELIDDAMVAGLSDSELAVRQEAVVSLLEVGESALPKIFAVLTLNNPDAVSSAFEVIERTNENSLPGLMGLLKNSSAPEGQKNAAILIRKLGPLAKAAGPDLTALLKSPRPDIRQEAALALIAIPYEPEKAAPVLAQGLTEPLSYDLIQSLAQMGSAAKSAVPTLQKILKNGKDGYLSKPYPKPAVAEALSKIDPRRSTWIDI